MPRRTLRLKDLQHDFYKVARPVRDDGLRHLAFEYGGSTLCGKRMLTLRQDGAQGRDDCEECFAVRTARSA